MLWPITVCSIVWVKKECGEGTMVSKVEEMLVVSRKVSSMGLSEKSLIVPHVGFLSEYQIRSSISMK